MRVSNYFTRPKVHLFQVPQGPHVASLRHETSSAASADQSTHLPSAELGHLLDQVRQQPATRPDLMTAVRQRLVDGAYLTPAAALGTADAIQGMSE